MGIVGYRYLGKLEDPGAFVISIRLEAKINLNVLVDIGSDINVMTYCVYKELSREELKNVNRGITMLNHSKVEPTRLLKDVICQVGVTTIIVKFLILDMPLERDTPILVGRGFLYTYGSILNIIERITSTFDGIFHQTFCVAKTSLNTKESDCDDDEDYEIQRNSFGAPMYGPNPAKYLNCHDPLDRSIALHEVLNPFRKIFVWKMAVSFLVSLPISLQHEDWQLKYTGNYCKKVEGDEKWHAEIRLTDPYGNLYDQGYGEVIDEILTIKLGVAGTDEEIFTSEPWTRTFNIDEPIYEVCVDDELRTKKIIKFRLCGRAFSWTLLEFARRFELYHSKEIIEEGFDVYFQGGLGSDEYFNARDY
uniref:Uncharacterized protein n=1 Tax=Tanacetum cinerariifolium TaxID=118510 RepID=A0A6L2MA53_TANCI|nr:hypothetical protein [Tanacetum cinerariifolium]